MEFSGFWTFGAGLSIFLFAISELEASLKGLTGRSFKKFLHRQTSHPFRAVLGGAVVTALLQSSSVVMLLTLSFVGAGVLSTRNALALAIGSNIGTTVDSWIIAWIGFRFDIESFAFPILTLALFLRLLRKDRTQVERWFRFLLSFGLLFSALSLMKSSLGPQSSLHELVGNPAWHPFYFVLIGFLLTSIIQSSFAMVAISLAALDSDMLNLTQAAGLILGAEAGTAIKFLFGLDSRPIEARRLALGNFIMNVVTVISGTLLLFPFTRLFHETVFPGDPLSSLVGFQTAMNLVSFLIFYPFIGRFSGWLESKITGAQDSMAVFPMATLRAPDYDELQAAVVRLAGDSEELIKIAIGSGKTVESESHSSFRRFFLKRKSFLDRYRNLKQLHGVVLEELADHLVSEAENVEYEKWSTMVDVISNILHASKTIKDIRPNLQELKDSANDHLFGIRASISSDYESFFRRLHSEEIPFDLERELDSNRKWHAERVSEAIGLLQQHRIKEYESSTLMNIHHEMYSSRKALLRAYAGLRRLNAISVQRTSGPVAQ